MEDKTAPQQLPRTAAIIAARRWRWIVMGEVQSGPLRRVQLASMEADAPDLDVLLEPFDRLDPVGNPKRAQHVSAAWMRAWTGGWPATGYPLLPLTAPVDLPIALLRHQLAPALALVRGEGVRLLLSDAVGHGKTIEAGLIVRELAARSAADRVLILTPQSLRDQWREQLATRCLLNATVLDRAELRVLERQTPSGINPLQTPRLFVMSMDLAKQPDVLARLSAVCWDALVIDEAHGTSGDSARAAAAEALGMRARVVLLLTATPHAGDDDAFARLCRIGRLEAEPPPLWFRHRDDGAIGGRRAKVCEISPARPPEEGECAAVLSRYVRQLDRTGSPESRLIALVLRKRALSSPAALAASLRHRLQWLSQTVDCEQPWLPFDSEEVEAGDVEQPSVLREHGLRDPEAELAALALVLDAAERAQLTWSKQRTIERLVRSTRERVLIFTEYRDTLQALVARLSEATSVVALHGGMGRADRVASLSQFVSGPARALVATDVAAEGLNLQHGCRLVVHVELPWSPARLEQRDGRVHRLGQTRRVHVWRLLGNPRHESRVVAALATRLARMRAAGVFVGTAGTVAPGTTAVGPSAHARTLTGRDSDHCIPDVLSRIRHLVAACANQGQARTASRPRSSLAWRWARARPHGLPAGVTVICRLPASARGSRPALVPVHVELSSRPPGSPSRWLPAVAEKAAAALDARSADLELTAALVRREHALLSLAIDEQSRVAARWQGSLFERRTARIVQAARTDAASRVDEHRQRLSDLATASEARAVPVLALLVR